MRHFGNSPLRGLRVVLIRVVALGSLGMVLSCNSERNEPAEKATKELSESERSAFVERGNKAAGVLMMSLSSQLKAALTSGTPIEAVRVCQQVALPITRSTGEQFDGLEIQRTSLKVRNPKNAPDSGDRSVLESWQALLDEQKPLPAHTLQANESEVRFYKPLVTQALCLKCHGESDSFDPKLRELLDELYPGDQARGYKPGDLPGAIRVSMISEPAGTSP